MTLFFSLHTAASTKSLFLSIVSSQSGGSEVEDLVDRRSYRASRASRASAMTYNSVVTYASRSAYSTKNRSSYQPSRASVQTYGSSVLTYGSRASMWFSTPPQRNSKYLQDELPDDNSELPSPATRNVPRPSHPLPWAPRLSSVSRRPLPPLPTPSAASLAQSPPASANLATSLAAHQARIRPLPRPPPSLMVTQSSSPERFGSVGRVVNSYKGGRRSLRLSSVQNTEGSRSSGLGINGGVGNRRGSTKGARRAGGASVQSSRATSMVNGMARPLIIPGVDELVALLNEADGPVLASVATAVDVELKEPKEMGDSNVGGNGTGDGGDAVGDDSSNHQISSTRKPKLECNTSSTATVRASLAVPPRFSFAVPPISPGLTTPLSPGNETGASSILRAVADMDFPLPPSPVIPPLPEEGLKLTPFPTEVPRSAPPGKSEMEVKDNYARRNTMADVIAPSSTAVARLVSAIAEVAVHSSKQAQHIPGSKPAPKPIDVEAANRYDPVSAVPTARSILSTSGQGSSADSAEGSHSSCNDNSNETSCSSFGADGASAVSHNVVKPTNVEKPRSIAHSEQIPLSAPPVMPLKIRRSGSKSSSMLAPTSYAFSQMQRSSSPLVAPLRFKGRDSKHSLKSMSEAPTGSSDSETKDATIGGGKAPRAAATTNQSECLKAGGPVNGNSTLTGVVAISSRSSIRRTHATPALIPLPNKPNPIQIPSRPRFPYAPSKDTTVSTHVQIPDGSEQSVDVKDLETKSTESVNLDAPAPSPTPTPLTSSLANLISTPPATGSKLAFTVDSTTPVPSETSRLKPKLRLITTPAIPSTSEQAKIATVVGNPDGRRSHTPPNHPRTSINRRDTLVDAVPTSGTDATSVSKASYAFLSEPLFSEAKPVMLHNPAANPPKSYTTVPFVLPASESHAQPAPISNVPKRVSSIDKLRRISNAPSSMPSLAQIHSKTLNRLTQDDPRSPMLSEEVKATNLASQECRKRRAQDNKHPPSSFFHHLDVDIEQCQPTEPPKPHFIRLSMSKRASSRNSSINAFSSVSKGSEKGRTRKRTRTPLTGSGFFGCVRISSFM